MRQYLLLSQTVNRALADQVRTVTDIQERQCVVPCNPWPKDRRLKEIGLYQLQNLLDGLKSIGWKMLKLAGFTKPEIDDLISEATNYIRDVRNQPTAIW